VTPSLTSLAVVAAAGFAAPLAIELLRRLSLPYVVAALALLRERDQPETAPAPAR
jgi:hypothetical protein